MAESTTTNGARPILHHLNADTSWLIQLPRPPRNHLSGVSSGNSSTSTISDRRYFNILLDPWLSGSQSDLTSWFSTQWHSQTPSYGSIAAVQALCAATEAVRVAGDGSDDGIQGKERGEADELAELLKTHPMSNGQGKEWTGPSYIDAVAISHEFTDHCHKATLLELPKSTPVFAWSKAAKLIKGWGHFENVIEVKRFKGDWRETRADGFPSWLGIGWLINDQNALYYHSALVISFNLSSPSDTAECIIYTPHGLHQATLEPLIPPTPSPPLKPLALLHGLHDISLDWRQQLNLGAHAGLAVQRAIGAPYWFATHDEEKKGRGIVSWFLSRKRVSVVDALKAEADKQASEETKSKKEKARGESVVDEKEIKAVGWGEMGNGEWVVLRSPVEP